VYCAIANEFPNTFLIQQEKAMKFMKMFCGLLIVSVLALILVASTFMPTARADPAPGISAEQGVLLSVVASGLVFALNFIAKSNGKKISREWLTLFVFGLSVVVAFLWSAPALPSLPSGTDPAQVSQAYMDFANALITQGSIILGFATLIYNWLLKRIDENTKYPPTFIGPDLKSS
jgi:uncharacterized membrane-anchored protein